MLVRLALVLTLTIAVIQVTAIQRPRSIPNKYTDWRLPRWVLPRHYKLRLLPFIEEGNFTGQVDILLECMEPTQLIVLHMADIKIDQDDGLQVYNLNESRRVPVQSYTEDKTRQLLVIGTKNETLQVGNYYQLSIRFVGQLNDKLNGFYRASYTENGIKNYLATTQFSPTDARRAFPCYDEPGLKSVFQITLGRLKLMISHSNMPLKQTFPNQDLPDYVWDEFGETLPMSTYILAFIVSEFQGLDSPEVELQQHTQFHAWTRPSSGKHTEYARILGPRVLRFFENYFNISFPLPKLDMFAIPDFAVHAMENWGLITYRETALLHDPARSSNADKEKIAYIISHELAHQWFGNLVTMEFWDDLWLKEGFAGYMAYVGLDVVDSSLQMGQQFTVRETQQVFQVDSLMSSHAMSMPVKERNDINGLFDSIPYAKGPAVIRMFSGFIGQSKFKQGLTFYLNNKKYQNAVNDDLWKAMSNQSTETLELPSDITTIMNSWSLQTGYPIVTVRRNYDLQSAIVTQERFYLLGARNTSDFPLWWIPLTYTTNFNTTFQALMRGTVEDGIKLELPLPSTATKWVIFNVDQIGYYRVNYDETNWKLINQQLLQDHRAISELSRSQLIDDSLNIARTGSVPYSIALELSSYLRSESDYAPWLSALTAFNYLDRMLYHTASKDKLREYLKWLILPAYEQIGFEERKSDSHLMIKNRNQMISWACRLGVTECVNNATFLYKKWMAQPDNNNWVNSNYKRVVICAAIANTGDEEWNFALDRYLSTDLSSEKEMLLYALSCSNSPKALNTLLEWALDANSNIRRQDSPTVFRSVSANPIGSLMVFEFVLQHWDKMVKEFPSLSVLGRLVDSISQTLDNETHLKDLVTLSEGGKGDLGTATRSVQQALERTRINLEWRKRRFPNVMKQLDSWSQVRTFG